MTASPRPRRIVLCRGQYCNLDRRADTIHAALQPLVEAANGEAYPPRIRLETANCLSMCGAGPNALVYPEGRVFNRLDTGRLSELLAACEPEDTPPA